MAPLSLDDSLDVADSVATWLASLFTGIGLVAVVSQLRSYMNSTSKGRNRFLLRAAGAWSTCFVNKQVQGDGEFIEVAPALGGWIQKRYLEADVIRLTQSETKASGTSSWSKFFAQCHILPQQLLDDGGPAALVYPTGSGFTRSPTQSDIRIQGGKILYGMSSAEFAAILVLSGFPVADLSHNGASVSAKYLGRMHLASNGVFSQIAHFDAYAGVKVMDVEYENLVHSIPVQGAIHVALGILKLASKYHGRQWIVIPQHCPSSDAWKTLPLASQLGTIRFNLEQLVMISGGDMITYSSQCANHLETEKDVMTHIVGQAGPLRLHEALIAAYAIDALIPWGLLPVAPAHFAHAFVPILQPCIALRRETVGVLVQRLQQMSSADSRAREKGWRDVCEQVERLDRIGDITTEYFCSSSNYCAFYYDAMVAVFKAAAIPEESIRQTLAATVAWQMLHPNAQPYAKTNEDGSDDGRERFFGSMSSHLNHGRHPPALKVQGDITWAVKIYATYMWAWLHDHEETDSDLVGRFERRVFLE
ncbi:hypothetical protein MMC20_007486 [Loxospora ochrophaea]|nr:hypothetical protein [Loxospora ochrophaea]